MIKVVEFFLLSLISGKSQLQDVWEALGLPGVVAQSLQKRFCGAKGCDEEVRGDMISKHYRSKTDFKKLEELRKLSKEAAEDLKKTLDPHTEYMFKNEHSAPTGRPTELSLNQFQKCSKGMM